jgi:hypothetical protein
MWKSCISLDCSLVNGYYGLFVINLFGFSRILLEMHLIDCRPLCVVYTLLCRIDTILCILSIRLDLFNLMLRLISHLYMIALTIGTTGHGLLPNLLQVPPCLLLKHPPPFLPLAIHPFQPPNIILILPIIQRVKIEQIR